MITMDYFRITVAEHDTIILPTAEPVINTDFFVDDDGTDEASRADNIILMSMHEIDPIEEHIIAASQEAHNNSVIPTITLDSINETSHSKINIEIESDEDTEDDGEVHPQSDVDIDGFDNIEFVSDEEDSIATEEDYSSTPEGSIDHIPNDENFDDDLNGEHRTTESYTEDVDETNQTTKPIAASNDSKNAMTTPPTTKMDTESDILTQLEMTAASVDDRSLLDLFAEAAKVYLTQQMVRHMLICHSFLQ
jgi:hypothetical protein